MKNIAITLWAVLAAIIIAVAVAYVFYESILGLIPGAVVGLYVMKVETSRLKRKRDMKRLIEFRGMLIAMQSSLEAGNSIERSLTAAKEEMRELYGDSSHIVRQLMLVERKMSLNVSLEEAMEEFANTYEIREIYDFAQVLSTIKKTGGNAIRIIGDTVTRLVEGIELNAELEVMVAAKKLEQQIMTFMPAGIIVFLRISNHGFLDPLYGNVMGVMIMTVVLGGNLLADYLGKRIVEIKI